MQIFTIVSGDYALAGCALINSLAALGFDGEIHVGFDGTLPWTISPDAPVILHDLAPLKRWISYSKPRLILENARGPFLYIDADCVVLSPIALEWPGRPEPSFCAEAIVPRSDIRRQTWRALAQSALAGADKGVGPASTDVYINAGLFAGQLDRDVDILTRWSSLIEHAVSGYGQLGADPAIPMADQDCLNAVLQDDHVAYSTIAPPTIWYASSPHNPFFHYSATQNAVLHCTGQNKPWRLRRVPPRPTTIYDRAWYRFAFKDTTWARPGALLPGPTLTSWFKGGRLGRTTSRVARTWNRFVT